MQRFVDEGCCRKELVALNQVRKVQESIFLSDIAIINGRSMDRAYATYDWRDVLEGTLGKHCSKYKFSKEIPPKED